MEESRAPGTLRHVYRHHADVAQSNNVAENYLKGAPPRLNKIVSMSSQRRRGLPRYHPLMMQKLLADRHPPSTRKRRVMKVYAMVVAKGEPSLGQAKPGNLVCDRNTRQHVPSPMSRPDDGELAQLLPSLLRAFRRQAGGDFTDLKGAWDFRLTDRSPKSGRIDAQPARSSILAPRFSALWRRTSG
jgi:uncharacterized protein (TIGR03435 family)